MAQLPADHTRYYLGLYFGLGIASIGVQLARSFALVAGTVAASRRLHQRRLDKVLRLPMSFFDTQPTGEAGLGWAGKGVRV
jgi:ABC-type multidrug transport system fused ATPase/permease subunit